MKILLAHIVTSPSVESWYHEIAAAACDGLEVIRFCVTLNPPGETLPWKELDRRWKSREKTLMEMYRRLLNVASGCDVLFLYNGANIHPEFLKYLPTFNVYCCFDDPESSKDVSAPVAASFDAVFYGNVASRYQYESWGCKRLAWLPIFTAPGDMPSQQEGEHLLSGERDIEISIVCEKNLLRKRRLDLLTHAFPHAKCYGKGWEAGGITTAELNNLYKRTKIGWNVHNSTGPINRRLFALSGFGVLGICDNKTGLGKIFDLNKEIIGFDTIPEAIELTRYYLEHEVERRTIAANGFMRFWKDYHAKAIWGRIKNQLEEWGVRANNIQKKDEFRFPPKKITNVIYPYYHPIVNGVKWCRENIESAIREILVNRKVLLKNFDDRVYTEEHVDAYCENPEMMGVNMAQERLKRGEPFEWPNMLALNWAVTSLIRQAKKIVDIGSGTGPFAEFASIDKTRTIHCFEEDDFARTMAERNRRFSNVKYFKNINTDAVENYDLLVSIDVVEHVSNLRKFLSFCSRLAPRAIFTTPNRQIIGGPQDMGPPQYPPHVREFNPGELYWVLKQYFRDVALYYMPDVYVPWLEPMTILTKGTPIIAECAGPFLDNEN